jgi:hypothetical protein
MASAILPWRSSDLATQRLYVHWKMNFIPNLTSTGVNPMLMPIRHPKQR